MLLYRSISNKINDLSSISKLKSFCFVYLELLKLPIYVFIHRYNVSFKLAVMVVLVSKASLVFSFLFMLPQESIFSSLEHF